MKMVSKRFGMFVTVVVLVSMAALMTARSSSSPSPTSGSAAASGASGAAAPASLSDITVEGAVGSEPKVTIPANLVASFDESVILRDGTGATLSPDDEVSFKLQKIALDDPTKVYSNWDTTELGDLTFKLSDAYKGFLPDGLRETFLKAQVGSVIGFYTSTIRVELDDFTDDLVLENAEEDVPQVWIITIPVKFDTSSAGVSDTRGDTRVLLCRKLKCTKLLLRLCTCLDNQELKSN